MNIVNLSEEYVCCTYYTPLTQPAKLWNIFKVNNIGRRSGVFIFNFEHILHLDLVFPLLTVNM